MPRSVGITEILKIIEAGDFSLLNETVEDFQVEFKGTPYPLEHDYAKHELAKDATALANANGGIILIGFRTCKSENSAIEFVEACRPFDLRTFDPDQYDKILGEWISPPLNSAQVRCFPSNVDRAKGVAAIIVPVTTTEAKPFLVNRTIDSSGKVRGTHFGYYERVQDKIPAISAEALRTYIRDGMRFSEVMRRLDTIESFLGNAVSSIGGVQQESENESLPGLSSEEMGKRVYTAESALERSSRPNIILTATGKSRCSFPDLFQSSGVPIVRLIEEPPVLRDQGFAATPPSNFGNSEIISGKLRRRLARRMKLIEVWEDGALITIGPGDDDMLCWFMRNQSQRKPGLAIRNFVLTEVTLNFCRLAFEAFKCAAPEPKELTLTLTLNNMTEEGIPCKISPMDDSGPNAGFVAYPPRIAEGPTITSKVDVSFKGGDAGSAAYHLLGRLYAQFGFDYDSMPYIQHDRDGARITPERLFRGPGM